MELKFIWVKEYNNIKETGFNFQNNDGDWFDYKDNHLSVQKARKPVIDFGDNIESITAIAGENGSGKSSLFEVVVESIATQDNGFMSFNIEFIGIVSFGNNVFHHKSLHINVGELEDKGFIVKEFAKSPLEDNQLVRESQTGFIMYSNSFDWRGGIRTGGLMNISTFGMLLNDFERFSHIKPSEEQVGIDKLISFYKNEKSKVVSFYLSHQSNVTYLQPKEILFEPKCSSTENYLSNKEECLLIKSLNEFEYGILTYVWLYSNVTRDSLKEKIDLDEDLLRLNTKQLYRINLLRILYYNKQLKGIEDYDINKTKLLIERRDWDNILEEDIFKSDINLMSGKENDVLPKLLELLKLHEEIVDNSTYWNNYKLSQITHLDEKGEWRIKAYDHKINCSRDNKNILKRFIELERECSNYKGNWLRLNNYLFDIQPSSGEWAMLILYSRLWEELTMQMEEGHIFNKFVLLLDEPEINMHPNWKRRFINELTQFLTSEFPKYKFQIIVSTHSPYLLSDLPSDNVLLLKRNAKGNTKIVRKEFIKTFGANIHELLSDSFFMKEGTIGEFSKKKINSLFKYLHGDELENEKWDEKKAWSVINIIGDENLKLYLIELYNKKVQRVEEFDSIANQIQRLRDEADRMEQLEKFRLLTRKEGESDD